MYIQADKLASLGNARSFDDKGYSKLPPNELCFFWLSGDSKVGAIVICAPIASFTLPAILESNMTTGT